MPQTTTYNGSDPGVIRLKTGSGNCQVQFQEETSQDSETDHDAESLDIISFSDDMFDGALETGSVSGITDAATTVNLDNTFTNPVVFATIATKNGSDPVVAAISNITSNSFQISVQEFEYLDGTHGSSETVNYIVAEKNGHYDLGNDEALKVETKSITTTFDGSSNFTAKSFARMSDIKFITQKQSSDSTRAQAVRIDNKTSNSFDMSIMVQESSRGSGETITATVGYLVLGTWTD